VTDDKTTTPAAPAKTWGCRTDDILLAHAVFRRLFSLLPAAVRGAEPYDRDRARTVATRIRFATGGLHHHHTTEDEMLWDRLEERAPACAFHVGLMRAQHERIAAELGAVEMLAQMWRVDGDPAVRDRLAERLDQAEVALRMHLKDEEGKILPVVQTVMTQLEWDEVGRRAKSGTRPQHVFPMLGLIMNAADPAQRELLDAEIPRIARVLYDLFGHIQYDRLMADLDPAARRRAATHRATAPRTRGRAAPAAP